MKKTLFFAAFIVISVAVTAQTIPSYIDTNRLLGWYPFSGNANNGYGTGLNGSVVGATLTTDRFGNANSAYHFDGIADHIIIDTAFFNVAWSDFTISWWANSDTLNNSFSANNDQTFFTTVPLYGLDFNMNWGHSGKYGLFVSSNPAWYSWDILGNVYSSDSITDHAWTHYVVEKRNDTVYSVYINGSLDSSYTKDLLPTAYYCAFNIGNIDSAYPGEGMWGSLDDYAIWKRALSACEIKRLFAGGAYLFITAQPANDTPSITSTSHFSITDTGTGNTYQWQGNSGAGFVSLSDVAPYSGVTTHTLTVTGVTSAMNNYQYRCVVTSTSGCTDTSASGRLTVRGLGVNNVNNATAISMCPNPTSGDIFITGSGPVNIRVYNTLGQLMKQAKNATKISIVNLPAGMYLVKLFDEQGSLLYYDRIVKQ